MIHPPSDQSSVFSHLMAKGFQKGISILYPPVGDMAPGWDFKLILSKLMDAPSAPLAVGSLPYLAMKVAFFLAITSVRRARNCRL